MSKNTVLVDACSDPGAGNEQEALGFSFSPRPYIHYLLGKGSSVFGSVGLLVFWGFLLDKITQKL